MAPTLDLSKFTTVAPFWLSLLTIPLIASGAVYGGFWVMLLPLSTWGLFSALDVFIGQNQDNADPAIDEAQLFWYRAITVLWFPVQFCTIFGTLWYVNATGHLSTLEVLGLFFGVGVISGTIGINYSHELIHKKSRLERWMGDLLLASVLYSHFRSEHLLVHHRHVATPDDPVTARYNETFYAFFPRVLRQCLFSAFRAEAAVLARKKCAIADRSNPFWRYGALQLGFILLAFVIGGWLGIALFIYQALLAIWQLELVNYIEHYGLTRRRLDNGRYEPVLPQHSWNSNRQASNWLLINLQRHSDHHHKPARSYPVLQAHADGTAPQLPYGYPVMTILALFPSVWRRMMNPEVEAWRRKYYPDEIFPDASSAASPAISPTT